MVAVDCSFFYTFAIVYDLSCHMKRLFWHCCPAFILACICTCLVSCGHQAEIDSKVGTAIHGLDNSISSFPIIEKKREARLDGMKARLGNCRDSRMLYSICDTLFHEYYKNDVDSALFYVHKKEGFAARSGDPDLMMDAALDLAMRYNLSGLYDNSMEVLQQIDTSYLNTTKYVFRYHHTLYSTWHGLSLTTRDEALNKRYRGYEDYYRKACQSVTYDKTIDYYGLIASIGISEGRLDEVDAMLDDQISVDGQPLGNYSILYYWKARVSQAKEDRDAALWYYVRSADCDMNASVGDSRSLIQVSRMLFERGDVKRAYRYMERAYADAARSDARICQEEIAESFPIINSAYIKQEQRNKTHINIALLLMVILLATTIYILVLLNRNHRETMAANAIINKQNVKLKDTNNLKDIYLGRYMSMFSDHINSLERYRSNLRVTAKSMDITSIQAALRSNEFIDAERHVIYQEFDNMFLGLFPDFVEQFNALLEPDKRIGEDLPAGTLSNELRVFALIRLGVTESSAIASFLRKSLSTVYNYRVKARNAAIGDRDTFEARIMQIDSTH